MYPACNHWFPGPLAPSDSDPRKERRFVALQDQHREAFATSVMPAVFGIAACAEMGDECWKLEMGGASLS